MTNVSESDPQHGFKPSKLDPKASPKDLDKAAVYLHSHAQSFGELERSADPKTLLRKIDWKIIPIAFACYTMQFLDKININVSAKCSNVGI